MKDTEHNKFPVQGFFSKALEDHMNYEFDRTSAAIENNDLEKALEHLEKAVYSALRSLTNRTSSFLTDEENDEFLKLQAIRYTITNDGRLVRNRFKKGHGKRYGFLLVKSLIGSD